MRKLILAVGLICLCAGVALAQGNVASAWTCGKAAMVNSIEVGDQPNHAYVIDQVKCTATMGKIADAGEKEGTATEFAEVAGNHSTGHGIFIETLANGDKIHYSYSNSATTKDGQFVSGSNKWRLTGGTGKFKGIKGSGGCVGKPAAEGSSAWSCKGTYSLPK